MLGSKPRSGSFRHVAGRVPEPVRDILRPYVRRVRSGRFDVWRAMEDALYPTGLASTFWSSSKDKALSYAGVCVWVVWFFSLSENGVRRSGVKAPFYVGGCIYNWALFSLLRTAYTVRL